MLLIFQMCPRILGNKDWINPAAKYEISILLMQECNVGIHLELSSVVSHECSGIVLPSRILQDTFLLMSVNINDD